ncbi:large conductance mechanosensitive channel protein MscL [Bombilactobacillus thymidiniphilus]|uniref:Large-conductance mechanosensitive channel n=1 Tax=Bombilactobacillus thymidiniphilus TaxID=2923363 RepID=A0ABY4PED6_9LACO|nr:large conductance mechanosensitive channel protein MscL [Bombilactobacillus thymidiniphilus]UQS84044.1 large conductance mechanosensitive channel protein MscL [Bombilactobacillus thymidiniphilus]
MLKEFKQFITRGNVLDLAIGVIIGGAFNNIVSALTKYILNPFIGLFLGKIDLSSLKIGMFQIGNFLNAVIEFLIISFVIFLIVKAINKIKKPQPSAAPSNDDLSVKYLQEIRDELKNSNN